MALINSPSIVTSGLLFYYDMNNPNSYFGPPLTNILPNGVNAGYPTYPSGWGTYNTNQYNGGVYFSIGTISSVVSNVVTTATNHPLRTYDVVTPQTTGGGVTAGTNYLVKKLSDTTFSLFTYLNWQDDYNIFSSHSSLDANTPVSLNSTSFPTMWWGPPHLPNSGIMKQIVRNGFQWEGRVHDCLRIHWYRPDGVKDGMAYGNEPTISTGQTYTIGFYHRAATPNCVGSTVNVARWTNGEYTSQNFVLGSTWQKCNYTFTTSQSGLTYFYWSDINTPARSSWDISEIMFYQGTGNGQYISSNNTRTNTQSIIDIVGKNIITATSVTYNNDGTFRFDGTGNSLALPSVLGYTTTVSAFAWIKTTGAPKGGYHIVFGGQELEISIPTAGEIRTGVYTNARFVSNHGSGLTDGNWHYVGFTFDGSTKTSYIDGVSVGTQSVTGTLTSTMPGRSMGIFGQGDTTYGMNGYISTAAIYSNSLTATEVYQNFNALKGRYGL